MTRVLARAAIDLPEFDKPLEHGPHAHEIVMFFRTQGGAAEALVARPFASALRAPPAWGAPAPGREARAPSVDEAATAPQRATLAMNDGGTNAPGPIDDGVSRCVSPRIPPSCFRPPLEWSALESTLLSS